MPVRFRMLFLAEVRVLGKWLPVELALPTGCLLIRLPVLGSALFDGSLCWEKEPGAGRYVSVSRSGNSSSSIGKSFARLKIPGPLDGGSLSIKNFFHSKRSCSLVKSPSNAFSVSSFRFNVLTVASQNAVFNSPSINGLGKSK